MSGLDVQSGLVSLQFTSRWGKKLKWVITILVAVPWSLQIPSGVIKRGWKIPHIDHFPSYKLPCFVDFPIVIVPYVPICSHIFYDFHIVPWFSHIFPYKNPWFSHGFVRIFVTPPFTVISRPRSPDWCGSGRRYWSWVGDQEILRHLGWNPINIGTNHLSTAKWCPQDS